MSSNPARIKHSENEYSADLDPSTRQALDLFAEVLADRVLSKIECQCDLEDLGDAPEVTPRYG